MGFRFPVRAYTSAQLQLMSAPARATDLEAIPHVFHDVQAFTSATTTALRFFQTVQATVDLGNFLAAGQLPDPMWFQPFYFGLDIMVLPTLGAATVVGALDDMQRLILTTRPTINLAIAMKPYIQDIPLSFLHTSGGATGIGAGGIAAGPLVPGAGREQQHPGRRLVHVRVVRDSAEAEHRGGGDVSGGGDDQWLAGELPAVDGRRVVPARPVDAAVVVVRRGTLTAARANVRGNRRNRGAAHLVLASPWPGQRNAAYRWPGFPALRGATPLVERC